MGTRAVRASVNSMLVVGVFDGFAMALAYAVAGAPRPLLWAAITGALAACRSSATRPWPRWRWSSRCRARPRGAVALLLGSAVLLSGDKLVRPMVARDGVRLPSVGC